MLDILPDMILILGAMDSEITAFLECMEESQQHTLLPILVIHEGLLEGQPVVVAKSGVGKAMSTLSCQCIIDFLVQKNKKPDYILFTGLAGALNPNLQIGDTLVAADCTQHDLDTTALNIPRGTVPDTDYRFFKADHTLHTIAMNYKPKEGKIHSGRILTGDQFITNYSSSQYRYMTDELAGDAVEMEGAAVALCATANTIPFLLIRTISDNADNNAKVNFREFTPRASINNLEAVRHIIQGTKQQQQQQ